MVTLILTTKLHIPSLQRNLVPRQRLLECLDRGLHRKLTLVSAPAGFGKTTLLGEWIQSLEAGDSPSVKVAWISLDGGDNDPVRFFAYLTAALQRTDESIGQAGGDAFELAGSWLQESHLVKLINQVAVLPRVFVLVLDDYHLITSQVIHDAVTFLVDHLAENMHLVLATRADPPLPLSRLRARGHLTELRQSDLCFTADEAAVFLNNVMGLGLSMEDVAALEARTEGWIAGLQMAALSLQGRGQDPTRHARSEFIQAFTGSHRFVLDYLVEEVLELQPTAIQEFLLKTSILERVTGPLCDAVAGSRGIRAADAPSGSLTLRIPDSQSILEHLEAANLFIVPLDDERRWYRYHRLFADLLRKRLGRMSPELVPALHRRASAWHEQQGLMAEAIDHALAAEDYERAAYLIERAAEATLMRSELATFLRWIDLLPDEWVRTYPSLCVYHAWALLFSGHSLDTVESRLGILDGETDLLAGKVAPLRGLIAVFQGEMSRVAELSRRALEQLSEGDVFLRGFATWLLGVSRMLSGDWVTGRQALDEAARMSREAGNVMLAVMVMCNLAELCMKEGRLYKAATIYRQALDFAVDGQGERLPIAGGALMGLGELSREWNDLEAAERYLTEGIELSKRWADVGAIEGYLTLARVRQAQGDVKGAREAILVAQQLAVKFEATELDDILVASHEVHFWITQGNLQPAMRWFEEQGLTVDVALSELERIDDGISLFGRRRRTREYTALARLLIAQGRPDKALAVLASLLEIAERWGLCGYMITIQILNALAFHARGDIGQAMSALERALCFAEPGGYVRIFVDEGEPMARLLYRAAERGIAPEYAGRLLASFLALEPAAQEPQAEMVEPLSERELEVLRLLAVGLSNPEIADELVIAVSTVRSHCKSIYGKLSVHRRWSAVQRAQELGLI